MGAFTPPTNCRNPNFCMNQSCPRNPTCYQEERGGGMKPGDIFNADGDIFLDPPGYIKAGRVLVSLEQEEAARAFGWKRVGFREDLQDRTQLVEIERTRPFW